MLKKVIFFVSTAFSLVFVAQADDQFLSTKDRELGNNNNIGESLYVTNADSVQTLGKLKKDKSTSNQFTQDLVVDDKLKRAGSFDRYGSEENSLEEEQSSLKTPPTINETDESANFDEKDIVSAVVQKNVKDTNIKEVEKKIEKKLLSQSKKSSPKAFKSMHESVLNYSVDELELSSENESKLLEIVKKMTNSQNLYVRIESYGYSDISDIKEARRASLQRAIKVRRFLIDKGLDVTRISVQSVKYSKDMINKVVLQLSSKDK